MCIFKEKVTRRLAFTIKDQIWYTHQSTDAKSRQIHQRKKQTDSKPVRNFQCATHRTVFGNRKSPITMTLEQIRFQNKENNILLKFQNDI